MLSSTYETKPLAELVPGNLALVGTSSGNHIMLTLDAFQGSARVRDMLSLRSIDRLLDAPAMISVPTAYKVGIDLGRDFLFEFDPTSSDISIRESYQDAMPGTIFVAGKTMLMMVRHKRDQFSSDEIYIDLAKGEFAAPPGPGTCVGLISWKLLLHSERLGTNPLVLRQWSGRDNPAA